MSGDVTPRGRRVVIVVLAALSMLLAGALALVVSLPGAVVAGPGSSTQAGVSTAVETVSFHEHGLLPGTTWGGAVSAGSVAVLNFSTSEAVHNASLPPGKYTWTSSTVRGYASPPARSLDVTLRPVSVAVPYRLAAGFAFLTFVGHGVPANESWTVTVGGTDPATDAFNATLSSSSHSLRFLVADGAYTFRVGGVKGYTPSPASGSLEVSGSATVHVHFTRTTYAMMFTESGLQTGTRWGVAVTGLIVGAKNRTETLKTSGTNVTFEVPNGTYSISVYAPSSYSVSLCTDTPNVSSGAPADTPHSCGDTGGGVPRVLSSASGGTTVTPVGTVTVSGAPINLTVICTPHTGGNTSAPRAVPSAAEFELIPAGSVAAQTVKDGPLRL